MKRIVAGWGKAEVKEQLRRLLDETNLDFDPYELTEFIIDAKNGRAIEELVALLSTKPAMSNRLSLTLQKFVDMGFASITPKYFTELTPLRNTICDAIDNQYRKPS